MANDQAEAQPPSYKERIDPGGEFGEQVEGLAALVASPIGHLLQARGLEDDVINQALELKATYQHLTTEPDRIARALAPLGWAFHSGAPLPDWGEAATLVEQGKPEEAEELLTLKCNESEFLLVTPVQRITTLYWGDEERETLGEQRRRLLRQALELHREERFAASIPIVLAQIDGIFIDATGENFRDQFFKADNPKLVDDTTIAGHPLGLMAVSTLMSRRVEHTALTGELLRHGILHGRELAYDTLRNSTKAFIALYAVVEAVKPRAEVLSQKASAERERRYAGSKALDAEGKRLDRRGFSEAKKFLLEFSGYQLGYHRRTARYAHDQETLDPQRILLGDRRVEIRVTEDAQQYWVCETTPTGFVFGVAGRSGDYPVWQYQGEEPPEGGIDSGSDWRHVASDPAPSEW